MADHRHNLLGMLLAKTIQAAQHSRLYFEHELTAGRSNTAPVGVKSLPLFDAVQVRDALECARRGCAAVPPPPLRAGPVRDSRAAPEACLRPRTQSALPVRVEKGCRALPTNR